MTVIMNKAIMHKTSAYNTDPITSVLKYQTTEICAYKRYSRAITTY